MENQKPLTAKNPMPQTEIPEQEQNTKLKLGKRAQGREDHKQQKVTYISQFWLGSNKKI